MSKRSEYLSKRDLHREYIKSPAWKAFRLEALKHYGAICNKCGEYGNDVDHKTYENWGNEKIEDVQILCRSCHEAKHAIERAAPRKKAVKAKRRLGLSGIWAYITDSQKRRVMNEHNLTEMELRVEVLCANRMNPALSSIAKLMDIKVQFPRVKTGWAGKAKERKMRKNRNRKLTPAEESRLIRAAEKHKATN